MIVTSKKVFVGTHRHVGGGDRYIGIPREIVCRVSGDSILTGGNELARLLVGGNTFPTAPGIVDAIVIGFAKRKSAGSPFRVVGDVRGVFGEAGLVTLVDLRCDV